ncbi:hypothetical protein [Kitasatospora sp. NPDC005856]|uniref:hypothetical protein n=1 Tax=Kitasatospora sp. NPDC005856 TaxID=3154566 RepID=UPI0033ECEF01
MAAGEVLRSGPDAATTDLVFHEGGGSRGQAVLIALVPLVWVLVLFGGVGAAITFAMVGFGADLAHAVLVASLVTAAATVLTGPFVAVRELRRVRRVQFAPAQDPSGLRLVRAGRSTETWPITDLARIHLHETITEPYSGDERPTSRTLTVLLVLRTGQGARSHHVPEGTDARWLKDALQVLLSAAGIPVTLETSRTRRSRPPSSSGSSSAHVAAIVANRNPGSGPTGSGGTSG